MGLLFALLAVVLAVGFIWWLSAHARTQPPHRIDGQTITFRHGWLLRAFSVFAFVGVGFLLVLWVILYPPRSQGSIASVAITALVLGIAGFLLCWEAYRFQLTTTPSELRLGSPWSGPKSQPWHAVQKLEYSSANSWFILHFTDGTSFRVSSLIPGVARLLEECERHLQPEQLAPAAQGYLKLDRKLPLGAQLFEVSPPNWRRRIVVLVVLALLTPAVLFVFNGLVLSRGESVEVGIISEVVPSYSTSAGGEVRVMSYNIAKAFAHTSGITFRNRADVEITLKELGKVIREQNPDLVFLSEVMTECGPLDGNQLEILASAAGLPHFAFGENYNFGLPFYRVVGGNAILSRKELKPVANLSLVGRRPFYITKNNRRALFASVTIGRQDILLGSLHNDSFDIRNNEGQMQQILEFIGNRPCLLAGDFNARPDEPPIQLIKNSGKFLGDFEGEPTFPAKNERIDFIFGPKSWQHSGTKVIANDTSDHRPVVSVFRLR